MQKSVDFHCVDGLYVIKSILDSLCSKMEMTEVRVRSLGMALAWEGRIRFKDSYSVGGESQILGDGSSEDAIS